METQGGLISGKKLGANVGGKIQALFLGQGLEAVVFGCSHLKGDPSQGVTDRPPSHATKLPANPMEPANDPAPFSPLLEGRLAAARHFVLERAVVFVKFFPVTLEFPFEIGR